MEIPLLREIVVIFALSIVVQLICHRIHIPTIVGFLITGVLSGPHGLGFVNSVDDVDVLATMGIVMLLFSVGMEFSLKKILNLKKFFLVGGSLQVLFTIFIGMAAGLLFGSSLGEAIVIGFLISLSSTAITLRMLNSRNETNTPYGRLAISIMIFQDIVAVPMMLIIPSLAGGGSELHFDNMLELAKGVGILAFVAISAIKLVPQLLYYVTLTQSRELFILSVLTICFAVAWMTSSLGLSLSLGAFLAGLIVSESEYSNEAVGDVLPLQDVFTSFFFISIGMLLDLQYVLANPLTVISISLGLIIAKAFAAGAAAKLLRLSLRSAWMTGAALAQIGEFSFVLAGVAIGAQLMSEQSYQLFLAVSLLTMALSPWILQLAPALLNALAKIPRLHHWAESFEESKPDTVNGLENHVIIVGFGVAGRQLALSCKKLSIPYTIIDLNADTVRSERANGEPIHYGDGSNSFVLEHAQISKANVLAIVINDPAAAQRIVQKARHTNPAMQIVVRTRYFADMQQFSKIGANDIVVDELGAALEVSSRVLSRYQVEIAELDALVDEMIASASWATKYSFLKRSTEKEASHV